MKSKSPKRKNKSRRKPSRRSQPLKRSKQSRRSQSKRKSKQRKLKKRSKSKNQKNKRRSKKSKRKSSNLKGWKKSSPRSINPRRKLYSRCKSKCFLQPAKLKYPICSSKTKLCKADCRALLAALVRSKQYKHKKISVKAKSLAKKNKCSWIMK